MFPVEHSVSIYLLIYIAVRELFFMHTMNKLTNKLMSRNYQDYQFSETMNQKKPDRPAKVDDSIPEDLGALQGFM